MQMNTGCLYGIFIVGHIIIIFIGLFTGGIGLLLLFITIPLHVITLEACNKDAGTTAVHKVEVIEDAKERKTSMQSPKLKVRGLISRF